MTELSSRKSSSQPRLRGAGRAIATALVAWSVVTVPGCTSSAPSPQGLSSAGAITQKKVVAQGQILPAKGVVHLAAAPGDVVDQILVETGEHVEQGQLLVVMRSQSLRQAQRLQLEQQRSHAIREQQSAIAAAEQRLTAANLKISHLKAQEKSLSRNEDLLSDAKNQVVSAQKILSRLESISRDPLTKNFVGQLELEKQRVALGESQLEYQQQAEALEQKREELKWALKAAELELESASMMLSVAQQSEAVKVLDLQIDAVDIESQASQIVAPGPGTILAVNATKGESSIQRPIIEMANTDQIACEVEINEMDAARVAVGQPAQILSRAFGTPLHGQVTQKSQLVGHPQLRPLDPLARVDYRAVTAIVTLDEPSSKLAKDWLQLQVEVEIQIDK